MSRWLGLGLQGGGSVASDGRNGCGKGLGPSPKPDPASLWSHGPEASPHYCATWPYSRPSAPPPKPCLLHLRLYPTPHHHARWRGLAAPECPAPPRGSMLPAPPQAAHPSQRPWDQEDPFIAYEEQTRSPGRRRAGGPQVETRGEDRECGAGLGGSMQDQDVIINDAFERIRSLHQGVEDFPPEQGGGTRAVHGGAGGGVQEWHEVHPDNMVKPSLMRHQLQARVSEGTVTSIQDSIQETLQHDAEESPVSTSPDYIRTAARWGSHLNSRTSAAPGPSTVSPEQGSGSLHGSVNPARQASESPERMALSAHSTVANVEDMPVHLSKLRQCSIQLIQDLSQDRVQHSLDMHTASRLSLEPQEQMRALPRPHVSWRDLQKPI